MDKLPITYQGFEKLEIELKNLKSVERPNVIKSIAEAREHGDLSENAEYHAAKEKQSFIEGRIADLENKISKLISAGNRISFHNYYPRPKKDFVLNLGSQDHATLNYS